MNITNLRKKLTSDIGFFGIILGTLVFLNFMLVLKENGYRSDYQKLKTEIISLDTNYKRTKEMLDAARTLYQQYKQIGPDKVASPDETSDLTARIKDSRDPLQSLKEKYKISQLDMSLTPPTELKGSAFNRGNVVALSSKVTLKFTGMTDELILSFIKDLLKEFPGYVRINSIDLDKTGEINEQAMATIRAGNIPILVRGVVVFDWIKLQEKLAVQEPKNEKTDKK